MSLVPVDTTNALAVSDYLDKARQWLHTAVEMTGPAEIAMAKAEIATAAEATKQLGLSKDIQLDAQEMVRRAEFALGKAIRKGQAEGTVAKAQDTLRQNRSDQPEERDTVSPDAFTTAGRERNDVYTMASTPTADFEAAIAEAKAEGNLSRANVVRKTGVAKAPNRKPLTDSARNAGWDLRKAVERLERIAADDRFGSNKEQVAPLLRSHLQNAVEVCQDLLARIDN